MAAIVLDNLCKTFRDKGGDVRAVDRLDLCVADGELLVLVGPSGCGKTTTLRLIAGLEDPDEGTIRIGDRIVNAIAPKDRDAAMVFQNLALYPHMTIRGNMGFGLKMRRVARREIDRKVAATASMLGIEPLLGRKPAALSGGERQRAALGRAIVRDPKVFLFDEPLSSLDAELRRRMRIELKDLHRKLGATMIYVTHNQEEAMTMGDRIAVMKGGAIRQCGAPIEVYDRPADRFVARFIGTPPMGFLTGSIEAIDGKACFVGSAARLPLPADAATALRKHHGSPVVLGIRPEHVRVSHACASQRVSEDSSAPAFAPASAGEIEVNHSGTLHRPAPAWAAVENLTVHSIEPMGDCTVVQFATATQETLTARVPPAASVHLDGRATAHIDMSRIHLFHAAETGKRLEKGSGVFPRRPLPDA